MTGDELEPIKPEFSDQGGAEAYIQAMLAQQQQLYKPIDNDLAFQMPMQFSERQSSNNQAQQESVRSQKENSAPFKETETDSFERDRAQVQKPIDERMPYQLSGRPTNTIAFSSLEKPQVDKNQEKKNKIKSILSQSPVQAQEINSEEEPYQLDKQDALVDEPKGKSEQNIATYGTHSVEIFKKDFDKSVATADKTELNEEQ